MQRVVHYTKTLYALTAAAISLQPRIERQAYLGELTEYTVYAGELLGITMALQEVESNPECQGRDADIYTDNQSALQVISNPKQSAGQYLVKEIIQLLNKLNGRVTLH